MVHHPPAYFRRDVLMEMQRRPLFDNLALIVQNFRDRLQYLTLFHHESRKSWQEPFQTFSNWRKP